MGKRLPVFSLMFDSAMVRLTRGYRGSELLIRSMEIVGSQAQLLV